MSQLQKVLEVWDECPALEWVVMLDDREVDDPRVYTFAHVRHLGEARGVPGDISLASRVAALDPDALATIIYTSGTTGPPKGAMLSQRNMVFEGETIGRQFDANEDDCTLSFLPLSHVAERLQGQIVALRKAYAVNIGEGVPTVSRDLLMVQPTILVCVPRVWEKMKAGIEDALESAPDLRRKIFTWARDIGRTAFSYRNAGRPVPFLIRLQEYAAQTMVYDKLRAKLGLARTKRFISGAAPLSPDVADFFSTLGMPIQEVYGQTECMGVSNFNPVSGVRFGSVGPRLDGVEVEIANETGEILVRGDNVFLGYFKNEEDTAATVVDGWLHTGDVGVLDDDGYLRITDRLKDIIVTAGGKNVSPQNIENRLKSITGFSQVVVVGDQRKFLSALVTIDIESLQAIWDRHDRGPVPEGEILCGDKEVNRWVSEHVERINQDLARYEQIKKFRILSEDFSVESGELTATLKVKRRVVQDKYKELIDRFYND